MAIVHRFDCTVYTSFMVMFFLTISLGKFKIILEDKNLGLVKIQWTLIYGILDNGINELMGAN